MGYTTEFKGILEFTNELTGSQLEYLDGILGEDCRDHPEWDAVGLYYIDLKITDNFNGIEWNGSEKTYDMEELVNVVVIDVMKQKYDDFGLKGKLYAQGEEVDDRWELVIENGKAVKKDIVIVGEKVKCPYCREYFIVESGEK